MRSHTLIVILAFAAVVGCSRGDAPVAAEAGGVAEVVALVEETSPAKAEASPQPEPSPKPEPRVPLLERRGDSEGPIPYRVVEPGKAHAKTPLVIALHGRGDNAEGFARLVMRLGLDARVIVTEAPIPFGMNGGRMWYNADVPDAAAQVRARVQDLAGLMAKLDKLYPDAGKPFVFGFSQGAVVALQAAHEMPDRLAGVGALSGYLATEEGGVAPTRALPVLVTAGTKDNIIKQDRSWAAAVVLEKQGLAVKRFAFDGPHSVPPKVMAELGSFIVTSLAR